MTSRFGRRPSRITQQEKDAEGDDGGVPVEWKRI